MKLLTKLFARSKVKASTAQPAQPSPMASFENRLAAAEAMAAQLESLDLAIAQGDATIAQGDATIARLKDELQTLQARQLVQTGQLLTLQTRLESASRRANYVLAAQGLDPNELPVAEQNSGGVAESAWQTYCSLLKSDPRKAGEYWATNSAAILASKAKAQK